jgi:hypothetical protein
MEFFTNRIKITSKWSASYGSASAPPTKKARTEAVVDKANFDGRM